MRTYVATTGAVFGLLVIVHLWRIVVEPSALDAGYVAITSMAGALCLWAVVVLRRSR